MTLYEQSLNALAHLLQRVSAERWEEQIRSDIDAWRKDRNAQQHRNKYGGHSTYSDWVISALNGHQVDGIQEIWANEILRQLQLALRVLAEDPDDPRKESRVFNGWGRHHPVLKDALPGGTSTRPGRAESGHPLRVVTCEHCKHRHTSLPRIETVVAGDVLGYYLHEAFESGNPEALIDALLDGKVDELDEFRARVRIAAENAGMSILAGEGPYPDRCPACNGEEVSVSHWSLKKGRDLSFQLADFEQRRLEAERSPANADEPRKPTSSIANRLWGLAIVAFAFGLLLIEFRYLVRNELPDATYSLRANWGLLFLLGLPLAVLVGGALQVMSGIGLRDYAPVFARQSLPKKLAVSIAAVTFAVILVLLASTIG